MFQVRFTENFLTISLENTAISLGRKGVQHCRTKLWTSLKQCFLWVGKMWETMTHIVLNIKSKPTAAEYWIWRYHRASAWDWHSANWKETQILLHQPSSRLPLLVLLRNSHFPGHPAQWDDMSHLAPTGSLPSWQEPCTTQQGNAVVVLACLLVLNRIQLCTWTQSWEEC